jgi:hypothetical protein
MVFLPAGIFLRNRLTAFIRARAIKRAVFSGAPVIERIRLDPGTPGQTYVLRYRNGLSLAVDESGLVGPARSGAGGPVPEPFPDDREDAILMNRIVLKSLLRYLTAPRVDIGQRERAAAAAAQLWLACEDRPGGPARPASRATPRSSIGAH